MMDQNIHWFILGFVPIVADVNFMELFIIDNNHAKNVRKLMASKW